MKQPSPKRNWRIKRRRQRLEGVEAGRDVDGDHALPPRRAVGQAVHHHHAAEGLDQPVDRRPLAVGTGLAEARHRAVDDLRIDLLDVLVAEAQPRITPGRKLSMHDVGLGRELLHHRDAVGRLEVERDRALAAVEGDRMGAVVALELAQRAAPVALRRLDLDDVGAVQRQQHRGMRPGDALREVEHGDAVVRAFDHGPCFPSRPCRGHERTFTAAAGARPEAQGRHARAGLQARAERQNNTAESTNAATKKQVRPSAHGPGDFDRQDRNDDAQRNVEPQRPGNRPAEAAQAQEPEGEEEGGEVGAVELDRREDHLDLAFAGRQRHAALGRMQHHQDVMVLDRVEQSGQQDRRQGDRACPGIEDGAQANGEKDEERAIDDDEEIIEPEIDPEAGGAERACGQSRDMGFDRAGALKEVLRHAGRNDAHHHGGDDQRREPCQCRQHPVQASSCPWRPRACDTDSNIIISKD